MSSDKFMVNFLKDKDDSHWSGRRIYNRDSHKLVFDSKVATSSVLVTTVTLYYSFIFRANLLWKKTMFDTDLSEPHQFKWLQTKYSIIILFLRQT